MIIRAVGLTSEAVFPGAGRRNAVWQAGHVDWLVLSSHRPTRVDVLDAVRRNGANGSSKADRAGVSRIVAARRFRFAFIDLAHPTGRVAELESWALSLQMHGTRLVVRGHDGYVGDELWAREHGAVMYLPGRISIAGFERLVRELAR
jgi:hypothetical protein